MPNQEKDDKATSGPSSSSKSSGGYSGYGGMDSPSERSGRGTTGSQSDTKSKGSSSSTKSSGGSSGSSVSSTGKSSSTGGGTGRPSGYSSGNSGSNDRDYSGRGGLDSPSESIGRAQPSSQPTKTSIGKGFASAYQDMAKSALGAGVTSVGGGLSPKQPSYRETENRVMGQYNAYESAKNTIKQAESRKTDPYNGVGYASPYGQPHNPALTQMTIGDVISWMEETDKSKGKGYRADRTYVGPYQIGRSTLKEAVARTGLPLDTKFSPATQEYLAMDLIDNRARQASSAPGEVNEDKFADRLAMEWAGLAMDDGRSYYDGRAGNKAQVSREATEAAASGLVDSGVYADRAGIPSVGPTIPDRPTAVAGLPSSAPVPSSRPDSTLRVADAQPGYVDPMVVKVDRPTTSPSKPVERFRETYLATPASGPTPTGRPTTEVAAAPAELTTPQKIAAGAIDIGSGFIPVVGTGLGLVNAGLQLTGNQTIGERIVAGMGEGSGVPYQGSGQSESGDRPRPVGEELAAVDSTVQEPVLPPVERFVNTYLGPKPKDKWARA